MSRPARVLAGIGFAITAMACFATLDTTTKLVSASVPVLLALWFRYAIQAVATTLVVLPAMGRSVLRTAHPKFQFLRGVSERDIYVMLMLFAFLVFRPGGLFAAPGGRD